MVQVISPSYNKAAVGGEPPVGPDGDFPIPDAEIGLFVEELTGKSQKRELATFRPDPTLFYLAQQITEKYDEPGTFNNMASSFGYTLPDDYKEGNSIASVVIGATNAKEAWEALQADTNASSHLLGGRAFFREQNDFGVWHTTEGDTPVWVVVIARKA